MQSEDLLLLVSFIICLTASHTLVIEQGQYRYPDGSVYTGGWVEGLKDGQGVYWDTIKVRACMVASIYSLSRV